MPWSSTQRRTRPSTRQAPTSISRRPSAAARGEIEVGASRLDGGRVRIWVEDQGTGIPAADLPKVYEPYFTTKRTGTGLGLAIARKVIEALGGSIRIDSREGAFTRVEIELPPAPPASGEVP